MNAHHDRPTVGRALLAGILGLLVALFVSAAASSPAQAIKPVVGSYKGSTAQGYDVTFRVVKRPLAWYVVGPRYTIKDPGGCLSTAWLRYSAKVHPRGAFAFLGDPQAFWGRFNTNRAVSGWAQNQFGCFPYVGRLQFTANYVP